MRLLAKAFSTPIFLLSFSICRVILVGCGRASRLSARETMYVSAPQVNLRDRVSAVYTKVGVVGNGEPVQVLEKSKRFYRVRASGGAEGWIESRYLVDKNVFAGFEKLKQENASVPGQAHGVTRAELNMHLTANRDGEHLYQLKEGEKVEVLRRAVAEKPQPAAPSKPIAKPEQKATVKATSEKSGSAEPEVQKVYEDWWLVRDHQQRVGWVLARMVDIDAPYDVAQYAEQQRVVAVFVLNSVSDVDPATKQSRSVPQYLMLTTEPKDGQPFDYNRLRVFTWNQKRHRYETAYKESSLFGVFPVTVGHEVFEKEGELPTFVLRVKDTNGNTVERRYKMNGVIVRRVTTPAEEAAEKADRAARAAQRKAERAKVKTKN